MTFVSSADTNKPAIYGIPTAARTDAHRVLVAGVLGDFESGSGSPSPLQLTDLPACALPQPPQAIAVAPRAPGDGGAPAGYVIVAVLGPVGGQGARVVTVDPAGLLRGAEIDAGADGGPAAVTPGVLAACPILGSSVLSQSSTGSSPGPAWPDGVPYADAGDLAAQLPPVGSACVAPEAGATPLPVDSFATARPAFAVMRDDAAWLYVGDAELPLVHVFDVRDPAHPVEGAPLQATSLAQPGRRVAVGALAISPPTRDYRRYLYAVDSAEGSVMVFDVTDPVASPRAPLQRPHSELNPLASRDRLTFASPVATVGFATHDWPINRTAPPASPVVASAGLLCNPNPNAHPDTNTFLDNGAYYRADLVTVPFVNGTVQGIPLRLRGVFGLVTLSNGEVVTVDVDDWDAPCRRPDPMAIDPARGYGMTGLLDLPEPDAGPKGSATYLDPYSAPYTQFQNGLGTAGNHAPNVLGPPALTDVSGAPVSTPAGGVASLILPTALPPGFIDPSLISDPTDPPYSQKTVGDASIVPGPMGALPAVRLSFDDPTASQDQDWAVSYEGVLPTVSNIKADIQAPGAPDAQYETLTLTIGQELGDAGVLPPPEAGFPVPGAGPGFCERGVEDWDVGQARASEALAAMSAAGLPAPPDLAKWTADYVEIQDDLLPQGDAYWTIPAACWAGLSDGTKALESINGPDAGPDPGSLGDERYNACLQAFGTSASADAHLARDLPILRAYDDHLDVGRFYWPGDHPEQTTNRVIVGQDPGSKSSLKFVACCFHQQATFKVRAGGEWVASGQSGLGFLHHVVASSQPEADPLSGSAQSRRCVQSCNPHDVLLNARSFDVPWAPIPWGTSAPGADAGAGKGGDAGVAGKVSCTFPMAQMQGIDRNSPLALHNPYFSYVTWMGCSAPASSADHTLTPRDYTWRFQVRGGFSPLVISLTGNTLTPISPQSSRYIQPFGLFAVVDGQTQGLELIDLNAVALTKTYY